MKQDRNPEISNNAKTVLEKRYLKKNSKGEVREEAKHLFQRVAKNIAYGDLPYQKEKDTNKTFMKFFKLLSELKFLPNSPTLMNAGRDLQQLSACFVLPIEDSIQDIFETVKQAALIHKSGGGTGFSFSKIRPKGDQVKTTGGVASGPISFMKVFNHATEAIKQGGVRRGANMGILRVDHPDILDFISCKADTSEINNFNISIAITDEFMEAYKNDKEYGLIHPRTGKAVDLLSARMVMRKISEQAHKTGEPGIFFIDRTNKENPTPHVGAIEATNPCGEQPLLPYESCTLGSINLENHLIQKGDQYEINWTELEKTVRSSVHFLDNVLDMNRYPLPEIEALTKANRKIGLGVMGFSRILMMLGIPYGSDRGIEKAKEIMGFIQEMAKIESMKLAGIRGTYPNWEGSIHASKGEKLRNATITTIAPTGSLSMIANTSGGCEPEFSLIYYKSVLDGETLPYALDYFIGVAKREGFWSDDLPKQIINNQGSVQGLEKVPEYWQRIFATSHVISPEWHVRMQAAFQVFSDSAVSKTINLPRSATVEDVQNAYLMAYTLGCKGMTVYRDGSREKQVLNIGTEETQRANSGAKTSLELTPELRVKVKTRHGNSYVHIGFLVDDDGMNQIITILKEQAAIRELFLSPSPHVKNRELLDMVCRLGSKLLRSGAPIEEVMEQLIKSNDQFGDMLSDAYALVKGLTTVVSHVKDGGKMELPCPECGISPVRMQEGCLSCTNCAWSKC